MCSVVYQMCFGVEFTPALFLTSMVKPIQHVTMHGSSLQFSYLDYKVGSLLCSAWYEDWRGYYDPHCPSYPVRITII